VDIEKKKAWYRERYKREKVKIRARQKDYYTRNKDKLSNKHREWYENNTDRISTKGKEYYKTNKDRIKKNSKEYHTKNLEKIRAQQREYTRNNKNKIRERGLMRNYNITIKEKEDMYSKQNGKCLICNKDIQLNSIGTHVDHNHKTNKVRGLLCTKCNSILGFANDNQLILSNAINYLNVQ